jgi:hypothetical protein
MATRDTSFSNEQAAGNRALTESIKSCAAQLGISTSPLITELAGRTIAQRTVRMREVVIGEPSAQLRELRGGIGRRVYGDVVMLEGCDEGLGDIVALGRAVRDSARDQAEIGGKGAGFSSCNPLVFQDQSEVEG